MSRSSSELVSARPAADLTLREDKCALEISVSYGESVLDVRHLLGGKSFVIGSGKAADMMVLSDDLPASEFPLVRSEGDKFYLTFSGEQRGEVEHDGALYPLAWLKNSNDVRRDLDYAECFQYPLPLDARATLRFDGLVVTLRHVTPPDRVHQGRTHGELRNAAMLLVMSTVLVLGLGLVLAASFKPERVDHEAILKQNPRLARFLGAPEASTPTSVGRLVLDTSPVVNGMERMAVETRLAAEAQAVERCVAELPSGSGVAARLVVDASGRVASVALEAMQRGQGDSGLDCVRATLMGVVFPALGADTPEASVLYTFGIR